MIELRAGPARAVVGPHGAELKRWIVGETALLWEGDPASWADTAPILFPIVGWAREGQVRVGGECYEMPVHGFARQLDFDPVERGADRVRLVAYATPATRRAYPFDWRLDVVYRLTPHDILVEIAIGNAGETPMPYACGVHPGFRWPFAGGTPDDYAIEFASAERKDVPVIAPGGLFSPERRAVPMEKCRLPLSPALMGGEALCFLDARSRSLRFVHRDGAAIGMRVEDFPHLALWSRVPGRFLCLEAWTGHGDPVGFAGELQDKPSQRLLRPSETARHRVQFSFAPV